jgi:hypothetical protein
MKKQAYIKALQDQPLAWVKLSAANPNKFMTRIQVLLHYVLIRRLEK